MSETTYDLYIDGEHYVVGQEDIDAIDAQLIRGERRVEFTGRERRIVWYVSGTVYWHEHRPGSLGRVR